MSFPLKEEVIYFEHLAAKMHRIYEDSCDEGLYFDEFDEYEARIRITRLMSFYPYKASKWENGKGVAISIFIEENHFYNVWITYQDVRPRRFITIGFTQSKRSLN